MPLSDRELRDLFAERLCAAMGARGVTPVDLAQHFGTSTTRTVDTWVKGLALPSLPALRDLADRLSVSADYLLGLTDDPTPRPAAQPADRPYHERLREAAGLLGPTVGDGWNTAGEFDAQPGDERPLTELRESPEDPIRSALVDALRARRRMSGRSAWAASESPGLDAFLREHPETPAGAAAWLADAVGFLGGHTSPLAQSPEFYAWQLARLEAAMEGREPPAMPEAVKTLVNGSHDRGEPKSRSARPKR